MKVPPPLTTPTVKWSPTLPYISSLHFLHHHSTDLETTFYLLLTLITYWPTNFFYLFSPRIFNHTDTLLLLIIKFQPIPIMQIPIWWILINRLIGIGIWYQLNKLLKRIISLALKTSLLLWIFVSLYGSC